jgi:short-subunit dehydrogenase
MNKRVWLITGISSGIGACLAKEVMATGDFVIGTFRSTEQANEFNTSNSGKGIAIKLDVTDSKRVEQSIQTIVEQYGTIDVLVNNAGIGMTGAIEESSLEEARKIMEVNFFAALKVTQSVLPIMRKNKKGHIIQLSSHAGIKGFPGFGIYNASKFALEGFSEALWHEVKPLGIHVSLIEPGPFRTKFAGSSLLNAQKEMAEYKDTAGVTRNRLETINGKQEGDPEKAAAAIIDLVNSENPSLRLPLGKMAIASITSKLVSVRSDLERNKSIAENAVFNENS